MHVFRKITFLHLKQTENILLVTLVGSGLLGFRSKVTGQILLRGSPYIGYAYA